MWQWNNELVHIKLKVRGRMEGRLIAWHWHVLLVRWKDLVQDSEEYL